MKGEIRDESIILRHKDNGRTRTRRERITDRNATGVSSTKCAGKDQEQKWVVIRSVLLLKQIWRNKTELKVAPCLSV